MDFFNKLGERAKDISEKAKDFGGKAMDLGGRATDKARDLTKRSAEIYEAQKIKVEKHRLEKEMENNLEGLGYMVYQKYRGTEGMEEEIERLCQSTASLEEEIRTLTEELKKLQPKDPICEACKVELPSGGKYCSYCGAEVVKGE